MNFAGAEAFSCRIHFSDFTEGIPSFLCVLFMVCAYSISDGIMFGILSYLVINLFSGKVRKLNKMTWIVGALFVIRIVVKAVSAL